eukprot:2501695-Prymnesium_polylepis.1
MVIGSTPFDDCERGEFLSEELELIPEEMASFWATRTSRSMESSPTQTEGAALRSWVWVVLGWV